MPFNAGRPIMLSLVGDSGAGKSTLSNGCVELLGAERVTAICLDDYHSLDRVGRAERHITALHPNCNHLDLIGQHTRLLRSGEKIFKPVYDHSDGTFGPPEFVTPKQIVLIQACTVSTRPSCATSGTCRSTSTRTLSCASTGRSSAT